MGPHVEFRLPKVLRAYFLVFAVIWFGVLGSNLPAVLRSGGFEAIPFLLIMGLGGGLIFYRMSRMAVVAEGDLLMLRSFFRTYRFTRQVVEGFRIGRPSMSMPFGRTIRVLEQRLDALRRWLAGAS
jgi:hypothetical protein